MPDRLLKERGDIWGRPVGLVLVTLYKGVSGTFESALGISLLIAAFLLRHPGLTASIKPIVLRELQEDPQDRLLNWAVSNAPLFGSTRAVHVGWAILILGLTKLVIAAGVWYRSWAIRNAAIVFFGAVAAYGFYDIAFHFSYWKLAALAADAGVLWYFWKILPHHIAPAALVTETAGSGRPPAA